MYEPPHKSASQPLSPISKSHSVLLESEKLSRSYSLDALAGGVEVDQSTSLEQMVGQIYPLAKYQAGCRFLQKRLEEDKPEQTAIIFNEIFNHVAELMIDPYGQYLVPKLIQHGNNEQRNALVKVIAPKLNEIACHNYGIHGIQKLILFLSPEQIAVFAGAIKDTVITLIKDGRGNYFVQSWLRELDSEQSHFIYDALVNNLVDVATHKVGCIILQLSIDKGSDAQVKRLEQVIQQHALALVNDSYGNYVLQHAIENNSEFADKVMEVLKGNIVSLCCQKFSSNVIEKCLETKSDVAFRTVFAEISDDQLQMLLQYNFANFVVQKALDVADQDRHKELVGRILPFIHQPSPNLKRIQKKILQV